MQMPFNDIQAIIPFEIEQIFLNRLQYKSTLNLVSVGVFVYNMNICATFFLCRTFAWFTTTINSIKNWSEREQNRKSFAIHTMQVKVGWYLNFIQNAKPSHSCRLATFKRIEWIVCNDSFGTTKKMYTFMCTIWMHSKYMGMTNHLSIVKPKKLHTSCTSNNNNNLDWQRFCSVSKRRRPLSAIEDLFHLFVYHLYSASLILIVELLHLFCSDGAINLHFRSEWLATQWEQMDKSTNERTKHIQRGNGNDFSYSMQAMKWKTVIIITVKDK